MALSTASYFSKRNFWILIGIIALVCLIITPRYGISGDEVTQHNYGIAVWNYIKSGGEDKTAVTGKLLDNTQTYYGGLYDGVAAMIADVFHPADIYLVRHYMNMLFGLMALIFCGLLAKEVSGWRAAIIAVILLLFTPRFFGEMFNNPKDIPFAGTYALGLYAVIRWLRNMDKPTWKRTILLGLALALGLSIRIGGLLLVAYLGLFWIVEIWRQKKYDLMGKHVMHLAVAGLMGYLGCSVFWPFGWEDPISHPLEALKVMSAYPLTVRMLFEGKQVTSTELPWYYAPKMLAITQPFILWLSFITGIAILAIKPVRKASPYLWMIVFATLFPVLYIIYKKSVLYDGIRHLLFVLPMMAVCGGIGINYLLERFSQRRPVLIGIAAAVVILLLLPARFMFAAHPNQYVYFNEAIGGVKGAYGYYETDYYLNSIKEAYYWLLKHEGEALKNSKDTLVMRTNGLNPIHESYVQVTKPRLKYDYGRYYEQNKSNWDYGIYFCRFLDREQLLNGYFPGGKVIHTVEADGVPLCVVLKNDPDRNGFKGHQALEQNNAAEAVQYLKAATQKYPKDMESWRELAQAAAMTGDTVTMRNAIEQALKISAIDPNTSAQLGELSLKTGSFQLASKIYSALIEEYPEDVQGYLGLAQTQAMQGNFPGAQNQIATAMEKVQAEIDKSESAETPNPQAYASMAQCYQLSAGIAQAKGDMQGAQRAANQANGYMQQARAASGQ